MKAICGDITKLHDIDVIVSAANGIGVAGAGVAGAIARSMGDKAATEVREHCKKHGPYDAGSFYKSDSGFLKRKGIKKVYHAVTMMFPGSPSSMEYIVDSLKKIMADCMIEGVNSIAIPGLGTGIGGLDKKQVANRMVTILRSYDCQMEITIIDRDSLFIDTASSSIEKS